MVLPHFVIIGAMKAGSTSLFRWLGTHPRVRLPQVKEPNFFSHDEVWRRGLGWYQGLFPGLDGGSITGEASVHYTDPTVSARAARRLHAVLPDARLLFVVRDPIERVRSHYRHEVQRNRERRPLAVALEERDNRYVRCSRYQLAVQPWLVRFPRTQLMVVDFEHLVGPSDSTWQRILAFLNLPPLERPAKAHNVTREKPGFSPLMRVLYDHGLARFESAVPNWTKRLIRPLLFQSDPRYRALAASSSDPIPTDVVESLNHEYLAFRRNLELT